jgi:inner membrane protein
MGDLLALTGGWTWLVIGGILLVAEVLAPGVFLIWFGLAALVVGTLHLFLPLSWQVEVLIFAGLSVVLVVVARPWLKKRQDLQSDQPNLNARTRDYIGRSYVLEGPIVNGRGRLRIDDALWEVEGPDLPAGSWVKVAGTDGMRLKVEAARRA